MFVTNTMNKKLHSDISPMSFFRLLIRIAKLRLSERKTKKNVVIYRPNVDKNGVRGLFFKIWHKNAKWILHFRSTFPNFASVRRS